MPGYEKASASDRRSLIHVLPGMSIGDREIFGPVLGIKRVHDFEKSLAVMRANPLGNGSVLHPVWPLARKFGRRTHAGIVGVNVGIPVPLSASLASRATSTHSSGISMPDETR